MTRSRARRVLKWATSIATATLLVLTALCSVWDFGVVHRGWSIKFGNGLFTLGNMRQWSGALWLTHAIGPRNPSWTIWLPRFASSPGPGGGWIAAIPLWIPLTAFAPATASLWYLDRRRPVPGACRTCGYNLTGNTTGVCPECGQSAESRA